MSIFKRYFSKPLVRTIPHEIQGRGPVVENNYSLAQNNAARADNFSQTRDGLFITGFVLICLIILTL